MAEEWKYFTLTSVELWEGKSATIKYIFSASSFSSDEISKHGEPKLIPI